MDRVNNYSIFFCYNPVRKQKVIVSSFKCCICKILYNQTTAKFLYIYRLQGRFCRLTNAVVIFYGARTANWTWCTTTIVIATFNQNKFDARQVYSPMVSSVNLQTVKFIISCKRYNSLFYQCLHQTTEHGVDF